MTYGTNDGSTTSSSPHVDANSKPQVQPYPGGPYSDSSTGSLNPGDVPKPNLAHIDSQAGSGDKTSVDTSSLNKYADNLDALADLLGDPNTNSGALGRLWNLRDLQAGKFKQANDLAAQITGALPSSGSSSSSGSSTSGSKSGSGSTSGSGSGSNSGQAAPDDSIVGQGGLRGNYYHALLDLRKSLVDTAQNVRTLAGKYTTIDEINQKAGQDLRDLINTSQKDLNALQQDRL